MRWADTAMTRGLRAAEDRARSRIAAVAEDARAAGIGCAIEGTRLVLSGRGLARRMIDEAQLRFLGQWS